VTRYDRRASSRCRYLRTTTIPRTGCQASSPPNGWAAPPPDPVAGNVLRPEQYAELLELLGFERQHARLQVYGHRLPSSSDVVEWMKGTSLTRFKSALDPGDYERFVDEYSRRLIKVIGDQSPYFYAFKRILLWGRLGTSSSSYPPAIVSPQ
jgi:trans-aconitate methyltransferase